MELAPGRVVEARSLVDDLNIALRWLSYPGRSNTAVAAGEAAFGVMRVDAGSSPA